MAGNEFDWYNLVYNSPFFTSTASGATWASNNVPNSEYATNFISLIRIASSADGSTLVVSSGGQNIGGVYVLQSNQSPLLNISPSNDGFRLSWIVPSANFVLQESADLTPGRWTDVTNDPTLNLTNLEYELTLPLTESNRFYRLKTP